MSTSSTPPVAYSYVRFSHPDQAKGDSLRRQTEAADDWCQRNKVRLDANTTFRDLGKSAYLGEHRKNPERHRLAAFLKLVEDGKVPRGSYLIIENLDRLSREHIQPALLLALNLLQAGIRIVQLKPAEMVFDDKSDSLPVMMMMMELSRGHGESAIKSERVGAAWAEKKQAARTGKPQPANKEDRVNGMALLTHRLPAWIEEREGKLVRIPERAAVVKHIYELSASGYGNTAIVRRLVEEKIPPFGSSGRWVRSYVGDILFDRRAVGEFQPRRRDKTSDGPPVVGYYPAVVTEDEWHAARDAAARRRLMPGRTAQHVNVFAGLLRNARDGDTYYALTRTAKRRPPQTGRTSWRVLVNTSSSGRAPCWSFPFDAFERAIFLKLREIDPHDILNGDHGPDETATLGGELVQVESSIALLVADLDKHGDSPVLFRRLRAKEEEKRVLVEKLAEARQKAAHPLSESWGEAQSIMAALDAAPNPHDARLRLRASLRRIVESIWLLVVPRGMDRLAAVQFWFAEGKRHRDYLILSRPTNVMARRKRSGEVWSLVDVVGTRAIDLRKGPDVVWLEKTLLAFDLPPPA